MLGGPRQDPSGSRAPCRSCRLSAAYRGAQVVLLRHQLLPRRRQLLELLQLALDLLFQLLTLSLQEAGAARALGEDLSPRVFRPGAEGARRTGSGTAQGSCSQPALVSHAMWHLGDPKMPFVPDGCAGPEVSPTSFPQTTPPAPHLHHGQVIPEEVPQPAGLLHVPTGLPQQLPQPCPRPQRVLHLPADGAQASRAELLQAGSSPLQLLQLPLQALRHLALKTKRGGGKKKKPQDAAGAMAGQFSPRGFPACPPESPPCWRKDERGAGSRALARGG